MSLFSVCFLSVCLSVCVYVCLCLRLSYRVSWAAKTQTSFPSVRTWGGCRGWPWGWPWPCWGSGSWRTRSRQARREPGMGLVVVTSTFYNWKTLGRVSIRKESSKVLINLTRNYRISERECLQSTFIRITIESYTIQKLKKLKIRKVKKTWRGMRRRKCSSSRSWRRRSTPGSLESSGTSRERCLFRKSCPIKKYL